MYSTAGVTMNSRRRLGRPLNQKMRARIEAR
jgi:hypothetical protein